MKFVVFNVAYNVSMSLLAGETGLSDNIHAYCQYSLNKRKDPSTLKSLKIRVNMVLLYCCIRKINTAELRT